MRIYSRVKGGKYSWEETINGRRYRMSTGVRDKESAKKIASKQISLIAEGRWLEKAEAAPSVTIGEMLDGLDRHYELKHRKSAQNLSLIAKVRADFGSKRSDELTAEQITAHIERKLGEGYAPATVNRAMELLRRAYKLAKCTPPDITRLEENNARQGFFTRAEFDKLSAFLPEDLRDFCLFGYLTGMRLGEIKSLSWCDVSENVIRLRGVNAKTKKPRSIVAVGELGELLERRRQARSVKTPDGVLMASTIFHRNGEQVGEFRKSWKSACDKAELAGRLFHDFRRTAIRTMVRAGVPQSVAMSISGHRTDATFRRYDICNEEDLAQAMLSVEKFHKDEANRVVAIGAK